MASASKTNFFSVLVLIWFVGFTSFATGRILQRAPACTTDACLSLVARKGINYRNVGCRNFFRTTVYPADVLVTATTVSVTTSATTLHPTSTSTSVERTTTTVKVETTSTTTSATTTTVTSTTTTTVAAAQQNNLAKRASTRTAASTSSVTTVDPYARSACKNTAQYSSACSCVGAEHTTKTLPASTRTTTTTQQSVVVSTTQIPTTTVIFSTDVSTTTSTSTSIESTATTSTTTTTTTSTSMAAAPTQFALQVAPGSGTRVDGKYLQTERFESNAVSYFTSTIQSASIYKLSSQGYLVKPAPADTRATVSASGDPSVTRLDFNTQDRASSFLEGVCSINALTLVLSCAFGPYNTFVHSGGIAYVAKSASSCIGYSTECQPFTFIVVAVS